MGLRAPRISVHMSSNQLSLANLEPIGSAAYLRAEVAELLDREWIKQECHQRIAGVCADTLAAKLIAPPAQLDAGVMLLEIANALIAASATSDLFEEAYVGPYDVANLCSDLLLHRLGVGAGCSCNVAPTGVGDVAARAALDRS
jgi:hypothetical protein